MTSFEIWKNLIRHDYHSPEKELKTFSLAEVIEVLASDQLRKDVQQQNGFYFLKDRQSLVEKRSRAAKISAIKLRRLRKVAWWLRLLPFVKMIGVTGRLAMKNAQTKSDWDIFFVLKEGKIWTGRTVITMLLHLFRKRRHGRHVTDRLCLNYFVTEQSLEVMTKDLFSASEYMFLLPLFGEDVYARFQLKNRWIRGIKPNYALAEISPLKLIKDSKIAQRIRALLEILAIIAFSEKWLGGIERKKIMRNPKTHQEGSLIYAQDDALIFLPNPHGPKMFEHFKEKMNALGI